MENVDLYAALGVSKSASAEDIKKRYRTLARELHPDRNPGDSAAEERFKQVSYAYQVLSDPEKRKLYNDFGHLGLKEGFNADAARAAQAWGGGRGASGGQWRVEDFFGGGASGGPSGTRVPFEEVFGGGFGDIFGQARSSRRARKGSDLEASITLEFAEAILGCHKEITLRDHKGQSRNIKVRIPPGVSDGGALRLRGQGEPAPVHPGGEAGDLLLRVSVKGHPIYWREGNDLHLNLPVTALEAFEGAKVTFPAPQGSLTVTVPKRTQSGAKLRLKGKGVAAKGAGGDLYAHVQVHLPGKGGDAKKAAEALRALEEAYKSSPRDLITF